MKTRIIIKLACLTSISALMSIGCVVREVGYSGQAGVVAGGEVVVSGAPPPPLEETVIAAPGPDVVWIPGAWYWHGRWTWERGRWDHPPRAGAVWVPHRYVYRNGRHVFVRGGWR